MVGNMNEQQGKGQQEGVFPAGVELEDVDCPHGCSRDDEPIEKTSDLLHGISGQFHVVRCRHCSLVRTNPRPPAATIGAYYPADYAPYMAGAASPRKPQKWRHRAKHRISRLLGRDVRRLPDMACGHMLEIGCASGAYLQEMRAKGWSVEGIEYSEEAAEKGRQMGLDIQVGSLESATAPLRTPDLVTAWMVLEHLHHPLPALRKIRQWVGDDAYFVGVVPDVEAFDRKLFGPIWFPWQLPTHLYHYSQRSLQSLFQAAGWDLLAVRWQPNERNFLISLERWLSAQQQPRALKFVHWLMTARSARKFRRWVGWGLGLTRQSGRMEFWARPSRQADKATL